DVLRERFVSTYPRTVALCVLAVVRARRGDPDAGALVAEAHRLAEPTHELPRLAVVAAARAELAWVSGRHDEIEQLTGTASARAKANHVPRVIGELARWRALAGVIDQLPDDLPEPEALELAGEWSNAAECWAALGCPYESAVARANTDDERSLRQALTQL